MTLFRSIFNAHEKRSISEFLIIIMKYEHEAKSKIITFFRLFCYFFFFFDTHSNLVCTKRLNESVFFSHFIIFPVIVCKIIISIGHFANCNIAILVDSINGRENEWRSPTRRPTSNEPINFSNSFCIFIPWL